MKENTKKTARVVGAIGHRIFCHALPLVTKTLVTFIRFSPIIDYYFSFWNINIVDALLYSPLITISSQFPYNRNKFLRDNVFTTNIPTILDNYG